MNTNFNDYSVNAVKTFRGMDGDGFNANLLYKGKKVAFVLDEAHGGCYYFTWNNKEDRTNFENMVGKLGTKTYDFGDGPVKLKYDNDMVVSDLVDKYETNKYFKRVCKNKIVVILKSHKEGEYMAYGMPYDPRADKLLKEKHGDELIEIVNKRFV